MSKPLLLIALVVVVVAGCTAIRPVVTPDTALLPPPKFSHEDFEKVLQRFVDDRGFVDYGALNESSEDLERYFADIGRFSPDSHPELFPSEDDRLAYWINAYNAASIKTVLHYYPLTRITDVKPPFLFFFLPDKAGFFVFQRISFGGKKTSLYYLENGVIRKRSGDPRIHFALNCAARGCPRLPRRAFEGDLLDTQLSREARQFLSEERNFRIDHQEKAIYFSEIFKWYGKDFLGWYENRFSGQHATLATYAALYLPEMKAEELKKVADTYTVRFIPYDWRVNDQRLADDGRAVE